MQKPTAVVLAPCSFESDPRHGYWSESLSKSGYEVLEMEIVDSPSHWTFAKEVVIKEANRLSIFSEKGFRTVRSGVRENLEQLRFSTSTGAFVAGQFRKAIAAMDLLDEQLKGVALVVANDLNGLVAALSFWEDCETAIVYDAQEIFTDSYDFLPVERLSKEEKELLIAFETYLISNVTGVVTVSPGIADLYRERHGTTPLVLPNLVPISRCAEKNNFPTFEPMRFVYIGRADPHRGLENLVTEWDFDPLVATLDLIIPESSHLKKLRNLVNQTDYKFHSPNFVSAVSPEKMVDCLSKYDVGILPYDYPYPYNLASPNKFGEYVAAGIPVIANRQSFVEEMIEVNGIGTLFQWSQGQSFQEAVENLLNPENFERYQRALNKCRMENLTWDGLYKRVGESLGLDGSRQLNLGEMVALSSEWALAIKGSISHSVVSLVRRVTMKFLRKHLWLMRPMITFAGRFRFLRAIAT